MAGVLFILRYGKLPRMDFGIGFKNQACFLDVNRNYGVKNYQGII